MYQFYVKDVTLGIHINSSCFTKDYTTEELIDGKFFCKNCKTKEECRLYYNFSMIARENPFSNKLIKLYLSSYDNEGVLLNKLGKFLWNVTM